MNKLLLILTSIFFLASSARASEIFDVNSEAEMDLRYDWVINVNVTNTNYLSYSGSKLKPLTKFSVSYRINPRFGVDTKYVNYEELWCNNQRAIGCRRLHDLDIPETYQGAIRFMCSDSSYKDKGAISSAIARLFLDIGLKHCVLSVVFVPSNTIDGVLTDLVAFRFHNDPGTSKSPPLNIYSDPMGAQGILYFY